MHLCNTCLLHKEDTGIVSGITEYIAIYPLKCTARKFEMLILSEIHLLPAAFHHIDTFPPGMESPDGCGISVVLFCRRSRFLGRNPECSSAEFP